MATLVLRLAAPLQSWGAASKFEVRRTEAYPTKSGVIGMIASALGRSRTDSVDDLNHLRFGVRADRPGKIIKDLHVAKSAKHSYMTTRYYLSDAAFLVGLESEDHELLEKIQKALQAPNYPLFLGRRSCPPTLPLVMEIMPESLEEVFEQYPLLSDDGNQHEPVEVVIEHDNKKDQNSYIDRMIKDQPISFSPVHRDYGYRQVSTLYIDDLRHDHNEGENKIASSDSNKKNKPVLAPHDAFGSLGGEI